MKLTEILEGGDFEIQMRFQTEKIRRWSNQPNTVVILNPILSHVHHSDRTSEVFDKASAI